MAEQESMNPPQNDAAGAGQSGDEGVPQVRHFGGCSLPEGRHGVVLHGWRVETVKGPILSGHEEERWQAELEAFRLPEMVFGRSRLEMEHLETGVTLSFNARDALKEWKAARLPPVKVPAAATWAERKKPSNEVVLDYDYTFTTPYQGTLSCSPRTGNSDAVASSAASAEGGLGHGSTFEEEPASLSPPVPAGKLGATWQRDDTAAIGWELLKRRDPILFFDEVTLYEDELADSGISMLSVRVRVMPHSWFALLRFWLRVDGSLMRAYETRLFCSLGVSEGDPAGTVVREYTEKEESFASLAKRGYPAEAASYQNPDEVVQRLGLKTSTTSVLRLNP